MVKPQKLLPRSLMNAPGSRKPSTSRYLEARLQPLGLLDSHAALVGTAAESLNAAGAYSLQSAMGLQA